MDRRVAAGAVGVVALLLSACGSSSRPPLRAEVVPLAGEVASHGYGYWLGRVWIYDYTHPQPAPCVTVTSRGASLVIVAANAVTPGTFSYTCNARAGLPAYVAGFSTDCDTLPQHHTSFGTSPAGLLACARQGYGGSTASVKVNGTTYDATRFTAASSEQRVETAAGNSISQDSRGSAARFIAYGNGLLLRGLGKGTYKITERLSHQGTVFIYSYTVHVS